MKKVSYKNMSKDEIDAAYNNTEAVEDFSTLLRDFQMKSHEVYGKNNWVRDLKYGKKPRQRYDFLSSGNSKSPTYIFFHGGYWSNCSKEDFAFIADGPASYGMNVILAEYTLAPQATMTEIVEEVGMLIENIVADVHNLNLSLSPLYLAGHSAGGHLVSLYRSHPKISKVHMVSALVDLEPISLTWLQKKLNLTANEIKLFSPILHINKGASTLISVGARELSELIRHSTDYAVECERENENVALIHLQNATHFSMLSDIADPHGLQLKAFMSL